MRGASPVSAIALGIAATFAMASTAPAHAATSQHSIQVGSRCQQDFQNNWQADAGLGNNDMWARCSGFQSAAATTEVNAFYYNLHGARWALEDPDTCGWGCGNADSVDLFYMSTHGGITSTSAIWAMWDQGSFAYTQNMRLGATSRQNMVLASFACDTHWIDDSTWTRWYPVFAGGMVMTVGGHDLLYQGNPQTGSDFANRMNNGETIGQSWLESAWYADNRNAPAVIATGRNSTDCWNRQGVSYNTLFPTPILRDSAIGYMCWSTWN
ncbi:MAG: DUF6345 domain-containing protein [Dokdonella sp.]